MIPSIISCSPMGGAELPHPPLVNLTQTNVLATRSPLLSVYPYPVANFQIWGSYVITYATRAGPGPTPPHPPEPSLSARLPQPVAISQWQVQPPLHYALLEPTRRRQAPRPPSPVLPAPGALSRAAILWPLHVPTHARLGRGAASPCEPPKLEHVQTSAPQGPGDRPQAPRQLRPGAQIHAPRARTAQGRE